MKNWLGINHMENEIRALKLTKVSYDDFNKEKSLLTDTQKEIGRTQKFIGAIFDYLGVRPHRTFVEDFSRLPDEVIPTMEVIKVEKVKAKK